jgi:chondroitin 4-sulfotransferase 11
MTPLAQIRAAAYQQLIILRQRYLQNHVFIHINKTAGTSIVQALRILPEGHKTALQKQNELGKAVWASKFSFAFVRNPWERLVSQYYYRVRINKTNLQTQPLGFPAWLGEVFEAQNPYYRDNPQVFSPQLDWLTDETGQIIVSFIGRFENLDRDFQTICQHLQRPTQLPHVNASTHTDYHAYYDSSTTKLVARAFAKDLDHFGYKF